MVRPSQKDIRGFLVDLPVDDRPDQGRPLLPPTGPAPRIGRATSQQSIQCYFKPRIEATLGPSQQVSFSEEDLD